MLANCKPVVPAILIPPFMHCPSTLFRHLPTEASAVAAGLELQGMAAMANQFWEVAETFDPPTL